MRTVLTLMLTALVAVACAGAGAAPEEELTLTQKLAVKGYEIDAPVAEIRNYRINGWSSVDRYHVVIHAGVSDRYLLKLRNPCHELRGAETLAFSTTANNLTDFDKIIVKGTTGLDEQCWIDGMFRLVKRPPADPEDF